MNYDNIDLQEIFADIPVLNGYAPNDFQIDSLDGCSNQNFRLLNSQYDWVLRVPKSDTTGIIDREAEAHNLKLAVKLDLVPASFWRNSMGLSLTPMQKKSLPATSADLKHQSISKQLISSIYRLHSSTTNFSGQLELGKTLSLNFERMSPLYKKDLKASLVAAQEGLADIKSPLDSLVPSHNDLILDNILIDDGHKIWLIDWEYSAMASPYWDIATLCNSARFDRQASAEFLRQYNQQGADLDFKYLHVYRYALQLLTVCWMARFSISNMADEIEQLDRLDKP